MERTLRPGELTKRVKTPDDWYPTRADGTVRASLIILGLSSKNPSEWRVCVWGDDDDGMERDFLTREEALPFYEGITDGITHNALSERGFIRA